jgi:predicted transcriptional regulator
MKEQVQDWQEYRRYQAYELHQKGWKGNRIAEALGVNESAVSQWFSKARKGGEEALRTRKAPRLN